MINFYKIERDALEAAQSTDAQTIAGARQALAYLSGVEGALNGFQNQYVQHLKTMASCVVAIDVNTQARKLAARGQEEKEHPIPPVSPAPSVQTLQSASLQVGNGRSQLLATIGTLESIMQQRAARIQYLAAKGGNE